MSTETIRVFYFSMVADETVAHLLNVFVSYKFEIKACTTIDKDKICYTLVQSDVSIPRLTKIRVEELVEKWFQLRFTKALSENYTDTERNAIKELIRASTVISYA